MKSKKHLIGLLMIVLVVPVMLLVGCGGCSAASSNDRQMLSQTAETDVEMSSAILGVWESKLVEVPMFTQMSFWNSCIWVFTPASLTFNRPNYTGGSSNMPYTNSKIWTIANNNLTFSQSANFLPQEFSTSNICFSSNNNTFTLLVKLQLPSMGSDFKLFPVVFTRIVGGTPGNPIYSLSKAES